MSPRTEKQLSVLKEARKEQILMAALELFSKRGYQNTAISDIAKKAKLSKGLLYNYFESKEDLLNEVVLFAFKETTEVDDAMYDLNIKTPKQVFASLLDEYFSMLKEQQDLMKLTLSLAVQASAIPSVHDTIMMVYNNLIEQLETVFINLGYKNSKNEAMLLGAIVDGIAIQYMLDVDNYPLEEMKKLILKKYIENEK